MTAVLDLTLRLADQARALGLTVGKLEASRSPTSLSRYVHLTDAQGRRWELRVSDHDVGDHMRRSRPNFDLVARASEAEPAFRAASAWLWRVAHGVATWRDPADLGARR